jgi:hypothetical protein
VSEPADHQPRQPWQHHQRDRGRGRENDQQPTVGGEQPAEGKHRAQVGDEARGQYQLPDIAPVQTGFDHHRVHDSDRGRAQRDASDLGGPAIPAEHQAAERERTQER